MFSHICPLHLHLVWLLACTMKSWSPVRQAPLSTYPYPVRLHEIGMRLHEIASTSSLFIIIKRLYLGT